MTCHHHRTTPPTAAELVRLRKTYADRAVTAEAIEKRFRISRRALKALAVREGWAVRPARGEAEGERT